VSVGNRNGVQAIEVGTPLGDKQNALRATPPHAATVRPRGAARPSFRVSLGIRTRVRYQPARETRGKPHDGDDSLA